MAKCRIVTLLSDFGVRDGYVASMKGVLLDRAPSATLVDISHEIPPGDILAGAFVLHQALAYFPAGTVHVAVVDPGVGTSRRVLVARYAKQYVVCPDNGLVSLVDAHHPLEGIVVAANEEFFLPHRVGLTFDGRDVMAPVAAALVRGTRPESFGPPPQTYKLLELPTPQAGDGVVTGQVIYVDHFGNCVSNISPAALAETFGRRLNVFVWVGQTCIGPLRRAFGEVASGEPMALVNSMGLVEVAVNSGRACDELAIAVGDEIRVTRERA
jgi:S-adenosylmethionine hydrolase